MAHHDQERVGPPPDDRDLLPYHQDEDLFEDVYEYKRHGFHPVIPGDILPKPLTCVSHPQKQPRYMISFKIGFGAFSTVWLAQDADTKQFVAIKVGQGMDTAELSTEAAILQHIRHTTGRGQEYIIQVDDLFTIRGPNGYHECFVTEVVVPLHALQSLDQETWKKLHPRCLNRQVALGFGFLHGQGIAHGDPHRGNIGIAVPQINQFTGFDLIEHLAGDLEMAPVIPANASFPRDTVPAYMIGAISIFDFLRAENAFPLSGELTIKIFDFGRASWTHIPRPLKGGCPLAYQAPEASMYGPHISNGEIGVAWSQASDIWAIGCILFLLEEKRALFRSEYSASDQILHNTKLSGPIPPEWLRYWPESDYPRERVPPTEIDVQTVEKAWQSILPTKSLFRCLLMRMIRTKPEDRISMREVLEDDYFGEAEVHYETPDAGEHGQIWNGRPLSPTILSDSDEILSEPEVFSEPEDTTTGVELGRPLSPTRLPDSDDVPSEPEDTASGVLGSQESHEGLEHVAGGSLMPGAVVPGSISE